MNVHAKHFRDVYARAMHVHAVNAHAVHCTFYLFINRIMTTAAIVTKPVFWINIEMPIQLLY